MQRPAEYAPSTMAAIVIEEFWDASWQNLPAKPAIRSGAFQRAMDEMQIALIRVHMPEMDKETMKLAKRTTAWLEAKLKKGK